MSEAQSRGNHEMANNPVVAETYTGAAGESANDPVFEEDYIGAAFMPANDPADGFDMTMVDEEETGEFGRALNENFEIRSLRRPRRPFASRSIVDKPERSNREFSERCRPTTRCLTS